MTYGQADGQQETYTPRAGRFKAHITQSPSSPSSLGPTSPSVHIAGLPAQSQRRPHAEDLIDDDTAVGKTWEGLVRPSRRRVEGWLSVWYKRWGILVALPCVVVWAWVAIPFPVTDPYQPDAPWHIPSFFSSRRKDTIVPSDPDGLPLDVNFWYFLTIYYGLYLHVALLFITKIFDLYRLNWWPSRIGGRLSYAFFWCTALVAGWAAHEVKLVDRLRHWSGRDGRRSNYEWERKTFWTMLTFCTMALPALVCFSSLRRNKRHKYRHALTATQATFLERQLSKRIPASYLRFLWFTGVISIALSALIAGQGYTSVFLSTLPHSSVDAAVWVWSWVGTTNVLGLVSSAILEDKVRSKGLLFFFRYFFALVYFVFYRNLFARLKDPSDFILIQSLSTVAVIVLYPLQMAALYHRCLIWTGRYSKGLIEHRESVAMGFYARSLAQAVSMPAFLGWLAILHYGPNSAVYPFFAFETTEGDPYTFALTFWASSIVWASELASMFSVIWIVRLAFGMDLNGVGLNVMREHPDLVPACCVASVHQLMTILLFLLKLNF